MRIRTIKPEFWTDSFMVQLEPIARLLYISLWSAADDHGYLLDEPARIAMEVMPREDPLAVDDWIQLFVASGRIDLLSDGEGHTCFRIAAWERHQRVDKPGKSRIAREGSRKVAIPLATRRAVAEKYGCPPGEAVDAACFFCGTPGRIHWHRLGSGRPSAWVTYPGLELDHLEAEAGGGKNTSDNIVLACRGCNRRKGTKEWIEALCSAAGVDSSRILANPREPSWSDQGSGIRDQGTGKGEEESPPADAGPSPRTKAPAFRDEVARVAAAIQAETGIEYGDGNWKPLQARLRERKLSVDDALLIVEHQSRTGDYWRRQDLPPLKIFSPQRVAELLPKARAWQSRAHRPSPSGPQALGHGRPPVADEYRNLE